MNKVLLMAASIALLSLPASAIADDPPQEEVCPSVSEEATADEIPAGTDVVSCGLVGISVTFGSVGVEIPSVDASAGIISEQITGLSTTFIVSVDANGLISYPVTNASDSSAVYILEDDFARLTLAEAADKPETDPCADTKFNYTGARWAYDPTWRLNTGTFPAKLDTTKTTNQIRRGADALTDLENDCGYSFTLGRDQTYGGTTSLNSRMSVKTVNGKKDTVCGGDDSSNVVDFGNLTETELAVACWWTTSMNNTLSSDIRFNGDPQEVLWTIKGGSATCGDSLLFDVQSVAVHEFGHFFGMGHVGETNHPTLTMSTETDFCDISARTLGFGDVQGLINLY